MNLRSHSVPCLWLCLCVLAAVGASQSAVAMREGVPVDKYFVDQEVQDFAGLSSRRPLWSVPCQKTNSSPLIAGDRVVLLERLSRDRERIRCFRLSDGQVVWEHQYPAALPPFFDDEFGWGPHATPILHDRTVFTTGVTGVVWAIDLETGKKVWSRDLWKDFPATKLQRGFAATAMVESNQLILPVGGAGSGVVALELGTGRTKWASTGFPASYTSPVVGTLQGQRQIVVLMEDALIGLAPSTGMLLWQTPFQTPNSVHVASPIIVRDRHVLVGSSGGTRLVEVSKRESGWTAETVWRTSRCAPQIGNYITLNDQAIAPSSGGSGSFTTSLNLKDGSVAWKERFGGRGSLFRLRDGILTLNDSGDLEIRRVSSSATIEVFRFSNFAANPQWGAPAFARNIMVLQTGDLLKAWKLGTDRAVRR